jgi:polyisoprenoid-binding protein YceI
MSTTVQSVPAGTWNGDPIHSTFGFAIKHNGVSTFRAQFEQVDAKLEDGVLTGTVQVDSVTTPIADLKTHLLAPDFFNASETPTIEFRSTDIRLADNGDVQVQGELSIRGRTNPVTATGTYALGENMMGTDVVGLNLEATVDRRDYGLNWQAPLPRGGEVLAWDVTIEVHLELAKA